MTRPTYTIAVDFSTDSRRAAAVAARMASRTHARLDFFSVVPRRTSMPVPLDPEPARTALEKFALSCTDGARTVTSEIAQDDAVAAAILRHVRGNGTSLLVVAPHGLTGWRRILLGSVTEKVLRGASTSVLVARDQKLPGKGGIIVGVDRTPEAAATLRHAIALARALDEPLTVVHVARPLRPMFMPEPTLELAKRDAAAQLAAARDHFERWAASFPHRGVRMSVRILEGSPAETLVGEARRAGASLVVVGVSAKSAVRRALVGSVARAVASACTASVLVVRPGAADRSTRRRPRRARAV